MIEQLNQYFSSNQLIMMRSTVFPGVTQKVEKTFTSLYNSIEIVFCPERLSEGNAIEELQSLPQLIGSRNDNSFERAKKIFDSLGVNSLRVTPEEAELAKLFTNVWRYIKFAAANQFYMISKTAGLDFNRIREALVFDYPRANDLPQPGFTAGPCLFKDTMALVAFSQDSFPLGHASVSANEGLPGFIVEQIRHKLDISEMTIGILGMAFKAEVDDIRSSLSFKLRKILNFNCKKVLMTDPYVLDPRNLPLNEVLSKSDFLIIATPHKIYSNLEISKPFFDVWNIVTESKLKLE
jgi:UDP-N-acetyl-D-mannosaminuronic acid dehydrogenase